MNGEFQIPKARSTKLWPARHTPLWHGKQLIGFVDIDSFEHGTITGIFTPGPAYDADRPLFERAVAAENAVATSGRREYQAARDEWKQARDRLQHLDLAFGDLHIPIEGFAIDADWRVEFESALWWDVSLSPNFGSAKSGIRWR